jgi:uncharacterized protein (DUF2236 family)
VGGGPAARGALTTASDPRSADIPPPDAAPRSAAHGRPDSHGRPDAHAEAEGLFGPDSETWRLDREAFLLLGAGPRALLLQIAHPLVAEGVEQHSAFRADPWARLRGTLRSYLRVVYGSRSAALAEIRRLERLHRRVTGPVRDPAAAPLAGEYRASDPELSLWVHATLVDSTLTTADAWLEPLSRPRRERAYAESLPIGRAFGIPEALLPPDLEAFEAYVGAMLAPEGPVHPTATARSLAGHIVHPTLAPLAPPPVDGILGPALGAMPRALYDWLLWPAIGLLPIAVREAYGFPWGPGHAAVAAWLVRGWQVWDPLLPTGFRWMPQARAADRRMRAMLGTASD